MYEEPAVFSYGLRRVMNDEAVGSVYGVSPR